MEDLNLNSLINTALCTKDQDYMSSEGMKIFNKTFEDISKKDNSALKIFLYFFPLCSPLEKNDKEFWFMKYKNEKNYNEYEFAKDILKCYIQYLSDKDSKSFDINVMKKLLLFKDYKFIGEFLLVVKNYDEKIIATISYITKDPSYFAMAFETKIEPEKIQKKLCINIIRDYLGRKKLLVEFQKGIEMIKVYGDLYQKEKTLNEDLSKRMTSLETEVSKLKNDNITLKGEISKLKNNNITLYEEISKLKNNNKTLNEEISKLKDDNKTLNEEISKFKNNNVTLNGEMSELKNKNVTLNGEVSKMKNDISDLKERLDLIDARDTVKMSLRYLYKILFTQFSDEMKSVTNIWEQIDEIKKILSKPQFKRYDFVSKFIDNINYDGLHNINEKADNLSQKERNFKSIEKYFKNISGDVSSFVAEFFQKLPNINEFIDLNLLFFKDPKTVDKKFEEIKNYSDAYIAVFGKDIK